jgi:hypothetical protein
VTDHLLTTSEVAELIAVGPEWVREHATELRAIRIGDGPRGELRFELRQVTEALERRRLGSAPATTQRKRSGRRRSRRADVELVELPRWAS